MATSIKLDSAAFDEILNARMRGPIDKLGAQIAAKVDVGSVDAKVTATAYTTDRAISVVAIAHPAGVAIQAKHGALTKAAAACGFEVNTSKAEK